MFTPCDISVIKDRMYRKTKNQRVLEEFMNSEYDCVSLDTTGYANSFSCYASFHKSIKRFLMPIYVFKKGDLVILAKKSALKC